MRSRNAASALLALPTLASAVSLADLAPRATNLPPACEAVYAQPVPGCTANDFISMTCSDTCIAGLESLVQPIMQACGNQGIGGENLIVAFLLGMGPQQICHNAPPASGNGVPPGQGPPPPFQSSSWTSRSQAPSSTPLTVITSGTSTASSAASTFSSLLVDTTPLPASSQAVSSSTRRPHNTPVPAATTTTAPPHHGLQRPTMAPDPRIQTPSSSSAAATNSPAYGQTHSGSGSPFDLADSAASGGVAASLLTFSLAVGLALLHCVR